MFDGRMTADEKDGEVAVALLDGLEQIERTGVESGVAEDQQPERVAARDERQHGSGIPGRHVGPVSHEQPREGGAQLSIVRRDEDPRFEPGIDGHLKDSFSQRRLYIRPITDMMAVEIPTNTLAIMHASDGLPARTRGRRWLRYTNYQTDRGCD